MPNPMQVLQQRGSPLAYVGRGIATGQPRTVYDRAAQYGKFFAYEHEFVPLGAGAVGVTRQLVIDGQADFLVQDIALLADSRGAIYQFNLSPLGENFNNVPQFLSAGLGSGQYPRAINPPLTLRRNSVWSVTLSDAQTIPAANNVFLAYFGAKIQCDPIVPPRRYYQSSPFDYVASFTAADLDAAGVPIGPIPAGATRVTSVRADGNSDFEVQELACVSDGPCTVQIANDQDNWFLTPLRSELFSGSPIEVTTFPLLFSGERAYRLPAPRLITGAGYIQVTVNNQMPAATNRVQVSFRGQRLYPAGGMGLGRS